MTKAHGEFSLHTKLEIWQFIVIGLNYILVFTMVSPAPSKPDSDLLALTGGNSEGIAGRSIRDQSFELMGGGLVDFR